MKLSLCMICKDEKENLKRLAPIVTPYVDEWIVVVPPDDAGGKWLKKHTDARVIEHDYTQAVEDDIAEQMEEMGVKAKGVRLFNFTNARNRSFNEATGTHILWLDGDDTPIGLKELREFVEDNPSNTLFEAVYDYARDKEGNPISDHVRERVIANDGGMEWKGGALGLIHETLVPKLANPYRKEIPKDVFYVRHDSDHMDSSSDRNFKALLYEYLKTDGEDPRTTYYLGTEFFNHGDYKRTIQLLLEYIEVGGWDEERYRAWVRIAEAYHQLGDKKTSKNAYLNAQKELPNYPESYLGLGESYFSEKEWQKAIDYLETGLNKPVPKTKSAIDKTRYTFRPLIYLTLANLNLGRNQEANKWFKYAKRANPEHPWVKKYQPLLEEAKEIDDFVRSFVDLSRIAKRRYPETLEHLVNAIPDKLKDQELLLYFRRQHTPPKTWSDRSIVVFASQAFEEWGPDSLITGTGGSEEAVIQLTKRWVKMGYEVTVFNNCPEEKTVDGVKWVRYERFNPKDTFNVLISWRNNAFLEPKDARVKILDIHDVPNNAYYPPYSVEGAHVMAKSEYHKSLFPQLKEGNFHVVPNGIDLNQFSGKTTKMPKNLVWTSSYDRGLEYLLEMWPDVLEAHPETSIDIAYGWNLYDKSPRGQTREGRRWKQKMLKLFDQKGVRERGRLGTDEVAKLYMEAEIWAYPTDFPEIDCITATKAMAAGCVPLTTDFAVMPERNQGIIIKGDIREPETKAKFKAKLIELLGNKKRIELIREQLDVRAFSWDNIAKEWGKLFNEPPLPKDPPKVSIIIPTHNRPELLKEAVASAKAQTYPNKEIIVVYDDTPVNIIGDPEVMTLHFGFKNPAKTLNAGILAATGDYHFNMDDDDKFQSRNSLATYMKTAIESGADLVYSDLMLGFPDKEVLFHQPFTTWEDLRENNSLPGVYLVKADVSKKTLYNKNYKTAYDYKRNLDFADKNISVAKAPGPLYWYRQHGGQIQKEKTAEQDAAVERARSERASG